MNENLDLDIFTLLVSGLPVIFLAKKWRVRQEEGKKRRESAKEE